MCGLPLRLASWHKLELHHMHPRQVLQLPPVFQLISTMIVNQNEFFNCIENLEATTSKKNYLARMKHKNVNEQAITLISGVVTGIAITALQPNL